jgi:hypothetical protein
MDGVSHLKFDDLVYFRRDYYDVGSMLYEHIPVLEGFVSGFRKRIK